MTASGPAPATSGQRETWCPTCQGRVWSVRRAEWVATRETVGMVCQTCGTDYEPAAAAVSGGQPTPGGEARGEIAEWMRKHLFWGLDPSRAPEAADELLALPALRRLLAAEEAVQRVRALAEEWTAEADDDERWLNGPRVGVSEAQEYPATIRQARSHVEALRAALSAAVDGQVQQ